MSTKSTIRIKRKDGTQTGIYCHWDGYIEGVGTTLQLAYNTAEKLEELLKLGNLSILHYYTEPKEENEGFENSDQGVCLAYHRDMGEGFRQSDSDNNEYIYTFDEREAVWYVEEEQFVKDTKAVNFLGISSYTQKNKRLLLDAIMTADYDGWQDDEFAEAGKVVEACKKKAYEARRIEEERKAFKR